MGIPSKDIEIILTCLQEDRYQDAKDFLQDSLGIDANNHHLYYLKAVTCIYMNKLEEALLDLGEVAYLHPNHVPSMHALAYLFLRRGDFEGAVNKWLAIKTIAPKDDLAQYQLKRVKDKKLEKHYRNQYNPKEFILLDDKSLRKGMLFDYNEATKKIKSKEPEYTPSLENLKKMLESKVVKPVLIPEFSPVNTPTPKTSVFGAINFKSVGIILFFLICIGLSVSLIYNHKKQQLVIKKGNIDFSQKISKSPLLFSFTEKEIQEKKALILQNIRSGSYNKARIAINEFYLSNANIKDKDSVHLWESMLTAPTSPNQIDFTVSIPIMLKDPRLYSETYINFQGLVKNLTLHTNYANFNLQVDPKITLPVTVLDTSLSLQNNTAVSVFGKIKYENKELRIEAYNIKTNQKNDLRF